MIAPEGNILSFSADDVQALDPYYREAVRYLAETGRAVITEKPDEKVNS